MSQTTIILIAAAAVVVLLLLFLLRGRRQTVRFDATAAPPPAPARPKVAAPSAAVPPAPAPTSAPTSAAVPEEGHGVGSEAAAAIEDVIDQFVGIDAHPSGSAPHAHGDVLTTLKGLGPKAEARLHEAGVTTFAQIAAWDEADVAAIDAQMGAFKGRITRDRWVEQARLLAAGDTAGFETQFGKLGG